MRATHLLLALPALTLAQDQQVPFLERAKAMYTQATEAFRQATDIMGYTASHPKAAASAKIAEKGVRPLSFSNYKQEIQHSGQIKPYDPPEAFMVYFTGGNRTCKGRCGQADRAWNESVPWFLTDVSAPKLAAANCDDTELLCGAWGVHIPSIWFILRPQPYSQSGKRILPPPPTDIMIFKINTTTVTDTDIVNIHVQRQYLGWEKYEGWLHPWDGWVAKLEMTKPLAVGLYWVGRVPNWAFMIVVSLGSRYFVNKRMPRDRPPPPQAAQASRGQ